MTPASLLATALVLAVGAGFYVLREVPAPIPERVPFAEERITLPDVALIDQHGREHRLAALTHGMLTVVNFNYTTCESICPFGNAIMAEVEDMLAGDAKSLARPVRLLSITIDPLTDRPALLAKAAAEFGAGENWSWLTGSSADIERLLARLDATVADITLHDPIFLVGDAESGAFFRSLTMPAPEEILAMLAAIEN